MTQHPPPGPGFGPPPPQYAPTPPAYAPQPPYAQAPQPPYVQAPQPPYAQAPPPQQAAAGPDFLAVDKRNAVVVDASGVAFETSGLTVEFRWPEIRGVHYRASPDGKALMVAVVHWTAGSTSAWWRPGPGRGSRSGSRSWPGSSATTVRWDRGRYGSPCTCGPTALDHALPAVASQLVDHVIAPRRSGYVRGGLKEPQPVPLARQSRALFTTVGVT